MHYFSNIVADPRGFLLSKLLTLPVILIALTVHEVCHGYAAYKCGDPTAKVTGRLSFNPMRHIDPIGFLMLLLFGFGYAKPVLINPRNFRNSRRDTALVSFAGPLSNLVMAFFGVLLYRYYATQGIFLFASGASKFMLNFSLVLELFLYAFCTINLGLFVFNMIPIPPLDGSKILFSCLPAKLAWKLSRYEQYSHLLLFALLFLGVFSNGIGIAIETLFSLFYRFWGLVF